MNFDMIDAAAKRLQGKARKTPLLSSPYLDEIAGRRVLVKAECLQHSGSFKFRGGWSAVSALAPDQLKRGVVAYSSGNHAQGVASAAREHGAPAVIIMPDDAPQSKISNTRALGADVVTYDRATENRQAIGDALSRDRGLTMIKPFDNAHVIAGQATTGLEIGEQAREMGISSAQVLVPCGGGGLTSGIALALEKIAPDMRVHPVEPDGFDDVKRSLEQGKIVENERQSGSICDAILTNSPGLLTFPIMQRLCGPGIAVPDRDCLRAMAGAFSRLKIVIEPGGAVALAAALFHPDSLNTDTVIVVASGGNVDAPVFTSALKKFGSDE